MGTLGFSHLRKGDRMPNLGTVKEAADRISVSSRTIENMLRDGRLTKYRLAGGRSVRVDIDELLSLFTPEVEACD